MVTRFYFHAATSTVTGTLPTTEQSSLTAAANADAQTVNRSMDTIKGTSASTLGILSTATTRTLYYTKFVSPKIYQTSIAANTWTYGFSINETNLNVNFPVSGANQSVWVHCYVWKPSNGTKVGTILDGNTAATVDEQTTGGVAQGHVVTFTGAAVSGLTSGDAVIIFELWFPNVASTTAGITENFVYDGVTVPTENATTGMGGAASYIETPETLLLSILMPATILVEWEEA